MSEFDGIHQEGQKRREIFQGMAIVYGFFFILLSAIAGMSESIYELSIDMSVQSHYRLIAVFMFYLLVLITGLAMGTFGIGLYWSLSRILIVPKVVRSSLLMVVTTLPLFFSVAIGFMLRLSLEWILLESVVVLFGPQFFYFLYKRIGFF